MSFNKGTLWQTIIDRTEHAVSVGAQQPVSTAYEFIEDSGVRFFVRILSSLIQKEEARNEQEKGNAVSHPRSNPFLPYEPDLFVADISESHVALLNKFNVVDHHLLIVTRDFEDQEALLSSQDFEALYTCMAEYDSLGFYNGGQAAGASQHHKHLQIVPLPLAPEGPPVPIEPLLETVTFRDDLGVITQLPFLNVVARLDRTLCESAPDAAERISELYSKMLYKTNIQPVKKGTVIWQSKPYCLIVTQNWMFLIPRSHEHYDDISINSLGFAGSLLVRTRDQVELIKKKGPMKILREVACPWEFP